MNGFRNIWVIKPASLSRGRGVKNISDLDQLVQYIVGKDI
jgi:hypothetical protein